jgi:regulator of replication initiation timing
VNYSIILEKIMDLGEEILRLRKENEQLKSESLSGLELAQIHAQQLYYKSEIERLKEENFELEQKVKNILIPYDEFEKTIRELNEENEILQLRHSKLREYHNDMMIKMQSNNDELRQMIVNQHPVEPIKIITCQICGKKFETTK